MRRKGYMSRILFVTYEGDSEEDFSLTGQIPFRYFRNSVTPFMLRTIVREIEQNNNLTNVIITNYKFMN